jgi:hypothetical protein
MRPRRGIAISACNIGFASCCRSGRHPVGKTPGTGRFISPDHKSGNDEREAAQSAGGFVR